MTRPPSSAPSGPVAALSFPVLTTIHGAYRYGTLTIEALQGGEIAMPDLTSMPEGTIQVTAADNGSAVTMPSLETWIDNDPSRRSALNVRDGATVDLDALRTLTCVDLIATQGQTIRLPALETYSAAGNVDMRPILRASGAGSTIDLPALATLTGGVNQGFLSVEAFAGGAILMPELKTIPASSVQLTAEGAGSTVSMPKLTSWLNNQTINPSWIEVRDGATANLDALASLTSVNLISAQGGRWNCPR